MVWAAENQKSKAQSFRTATLDGCSETSYKEGKYQSLVQPTTKLEDSELVGSALTENDEELNIEWVSVDDIVETYKDLMPRLCASDYASLRADIALNGMLVPLIVTIAYILIDGYARLQIARELGILYVPVIVRNYDSPLPEERDVYALNLHRRWHLTTFEKSYLGSKLRTIEQVLAAKRQRNKPRGKNGQFTKGANLPPLVETAKTAPKSSSKKGKSRDIAGAMVGASGRNIDKMDRIIKEAETHPEIATLVEKGLNKEKISVDGVYKLVQQQNSTPVEVAQISMMSSLLNSSNGAKMKRVTSGIAKRFKKLHGSSYQARRGPTFLSAPSTLSSVKV